MVGKTGSNPSCQLGNTRLRMVKHPDFTHNVGEMKRLSPLLFFSICAVFDFVWGSIKWHSITAGVWAIVGGLPLTAVLYFLLGYLGKSNDDSDAPRT